MAVASDFPTLDPAQAADTESISAIQLMYEPLFSYGAGGQIVGRLASAWSWSAGGRRLTVDIQPRARFADGHPVTAADVVYSLDRMLQAGSGAPEAQSFRALAGFAEIVRGRPWLATGIEQRGAHQVVFLLTHPVPYFLELLAMPSASIVERSLAVTSQGEASWWFQHSAGSGPYVLGSSTPGESLVLLPNRHYWRRGWRVQGTREGPYASVRFEIISSPAGQLAAFTSGSLDVLDPLSAAQAAALDQPAAGATLLQGSALGLNYLGFNTAKAPFNRRDMRLAVAYALDKAAILRAQGGMGQVAGGLLPPGLAGAAWLSPYAYDPARARSLFVAAGGQSGLPVTLLTIAAGGTVDQAGEDAVAALEAAELDRVGFDVTVQAVPWQQYYQELAEGAEDLFQAEWLADYPDAQNFLFNLLDTAAIGAGNATFWSNRQYDVLDARAAQETSAPARVAMYRRLDAMAYADVPLLPLSYADTAVLVQRWLRPDDPGIFLSPPLLPQLDRVWSVHHAP